MSFRNGARGARGTTKATSGSSKEPSRQPLRVSGEGDFGRRLDLALNEVKGTGRQLRVPDEFHERARRQIKDRGLDPDHLIATA